MDQSIVDWLDDEDSASAESTVDEAWRLLRCAWHAKRAGNEAWGHGGHGGHSVEEAVRNYTAGLRCAARAERFVDLEALEDTDKYCFDRFQSALHMVEAVLHRNLSLTSHHQADFTAALEHAEESLRLEPQNVKSKYRRGLALWALDRSEEARKDLKDVLAKEPKNLELRRLLGAKLATEGAAAPATAQAQRCGECGLCGLAEDGGAASPDPALLAKLRKGGRSALHWALGGVDPETRRLGACSYWRLEALIDSAEVDALDPDERTPLHLAAASGHLEAVSLLMDASASVDPLDRHGRSPLYYAAVGNHREVVALLVDRGHADQSILFRALKEKFGTHNFMLHDWPEYNGRWMSSLEGRKDDLPLRPVEQKGPNAFRGRAAFRGADGTIGWDYG